MADSATNRIKIVLLEESKINKSLAEKHCMNESSVSHLCTINMQPSIEKLTQVANILNVDIRDLLSSTKNY